MYYKKGEVIWIIISLIALFCLASYIIYFYEFLVVSKAEISLLDKIRVLNFIESKITQNSFYQDINKNIDYNKISINYIKFYKNINLSMLVQKIDSSSIQILFKISAPNWLMNLPIRISNYSNNISDNKRIIEYFPDL